MQASLRLLELPLADLGTADHLAKTCGAYLETMHDAGIPGKTMNVAGGYWLGEPHSFELPSSALERGLPRWSRGLPANEGFRAALSNVLVMTSQAAAYHYGWGTGFVINTAICIRLQSSITRVSARCGKEICRVG